MLGIYAKSFMTASRLDTGRTRCSAGARTEEKRLRGAVGHPEARRR